MIEERFTIEILDKNNWLIEDTETGETANPIDGTTNVLKGLISTLNNFNNENTHLKTKIIEYEEQIKNLNNIINHIEESYKASHGMDLRNADWI